MRAQDPILVLDMRRVLDESSTGKAETERLKELLAKDREQAEKLRAQAKAAAGPAQQAVTEELKTFEREALEKLDEARQTARAQILEKARAVVDAVRQERGAMWVLDADAVVLGPAAQDITEEVIRRLDEG